MKKGNSYALNIEDMKFGGYGIASLEGYKINVKNAVPGQKVLARISKKRGDNVEGKVVEVLEKAPYEIEAPCPHFSECGGCTQEFVPYEKQLQLKEAQVLKLFKQAGLEDINYEGIEGSPLEYEYRNKMEFTFGDYEKDGELTLGMHMSGKSFGIVNVDRCQLVDEDVRKLVEAAVKFFREKKLPYYRVMRHEGYLRNLVVRKTKNTEEIIINIITTTQIDFNMEEFKDLIMSMEFEGKLSGILHTFNDSWSEVVAADKVNILYGKDFITEKLLGLSFKISPFSFFQTNSLGAEKLYSMVRDFMGKADDQVVFDLYCGTGTIGQIAAGKAKKVVGLELIEEAVESARENSKLNGLENCSFIAGDVAKTIQEVTDKPDIIILDPPRSGVHPKAMEYVTKFDAPTIIYVSCNPKTLMNDLKVLTGRGYEIEKVKIMDMFPQTWHVECVVGIRRKDSL
ncbi:23S rRNA (uracil(1939)-C(5))-methyltransferase RlmD [Clostridium sp. 19966]|uniref:23S rRNA (uracil(1939)-C(5))-methyltransferase RlmD n=1 Tax=Clostridium sp. 19966 TaxID=2768166 RepID=UPI0028DE09C7|nr:23S rRNA (uracil(1939)-C(5))-methyltransferase RlmD [Clostridium sp. 19966]MDT8717074.1 23S rRNA (uracil(1939)-C(5))-methyltransferase RlmD [Clostridium sp. 19966]